MNHRESHHDFVEEKILTKFPTDNPGCGPLSKSGWRSKGHPYSKVGRAFGRLLGCKQVEKLSQCRRDARRAPNQSSERAAKGRIAKFNRRKRARFHLGLDGCFRNNGTPFSISTARLTVSILSNSSTSFTLTPSARSLRSISLRVGRSGSNAMNFSPCKARKRVAFGKQADASANRSTRADHSKTSLP